MRFIDWFVSNWYSNFFTLITVVLSGIISLIISALYYQKGNRNNLKMAVIHPIIRLLANGYQEKITIHYVRFPKNIARDI